MTTNNILNENMVTENINNLKTNDVLQLKNGKYIQITTAGEYVDDVDFGNMWKNTKRYVEISANEFNNMKNEKDNKVSKDEESKNILNDVYNKVNEKLEEKEITTDTLRDFFKTHSFEETIEINKNNLYLFVKENKVYAFRNLTFSNNYYCITNIKLEDFETIKNI